MIDALHWLRPLWLIAVLPLLLAWWWVIRRKLLDNAWESYVDSELQPYVLTPATQGAQASVHALFLSWLLGLIVLAGPVWEQQPVPVFEARPAMMVVVDISPSMELDDLAPSRMERAVFKLSDLLNRARGMDIGLLVFAERPYVVSPLTDDVNTLQAFLPSLSTDLAPVRGSQLNLAIDRAAELLQQTGKTQGQIVLLTDSDVTEQHVSAAVRANEAGYAVSVIGIGTLSGAPLRDSSGNFVRNASGSVVVPKLDMDGLRRLAVAGKGISTVLSAGSADIDAVIALSGGQVNDEPREAIRRATSEGSDAANDAAKIAEDERFSDYWVEYAVWLMPLFLLLSLGLFRRGLAA